jgi:hypothetical protein
LEFLKDTSVPHGASGAFWLTDIARLEELSQVSKGLDWVVCARLGEMLVGGE